MWDEEIKKELGYCGDHVRIGLNTIFTNPKGVVLHDNTRIDPFCLITTGLELRSFSHICSHVVLSGGARHKISMGKWTFIAYGSKLFCASEDYTGEFGPINEEWSMNKVTHKDIRLADYSGFASGCIAMPGVELPLGCTIGSMSLVRPSDNLTAWSIWSGNPPKFLFPRNQSTIEEYEWTLKF